LQDGLQLPKLHGIEDQNVDDDAFAFEAAPQFLSVLGIRHVGHQAGDKGAGGGVFGLEAGYRLCKDVLAPAGENDMQCRGLDKGSGDGESNATRAASDEHSSTGLSEFGAER
jgi:hypothetical protein